MNCLFFPLWSFKCTDYNKLSFFNHYHHHHHHHPIDQGDFLSSYFYNICPILLYSFLSGLLCRCIYKASIYTMISPSLFSHAWTDTYDYYHYYNIYIYIYIYIYVCIYICTTNLRLCTYTKKNSIRCKQS